MGILEDFYINIDGLGYLFDLVFWCMEDVWDV